MPVRNTDIAAIFYEIADLLEIDGANPFRVRAYRTGAGALEGLGYEVASLVTNGEDLIGIPGIGKDLAAKIREIVETGKCATLIKLHEKLPPSLTELLRIPGLGPKRVKTLFQERNISTLEQLQYAVQEGRIRNLPGFGEKSERQILEALHARADIGRRFLLSTASRYGEPLLAYLKKNPGVDKAVLAGSYRRERETVGDLDILVTLSPALHGRKDRSPVMDRLAGYDEVREVVSQGNTRATVILQSGLQVDVRIVDPECYGAALQYFTGSKAHNIAIRRLGQERGFKMNEYGVFQGEQRVAGETEESVYLAVGLPEIPPELREGRGEIESSLAENLPRLVRLADLKGDLHVHSHASDGHWTFREIVEQGRKRGFAYAAVTDHSQRLTVAHGLDPSRLLEQIAAIDRFNEELRDFRLLKGIEVDILEDGSLDLPDDVLRRLDLVVGAVHSKFKLSPTKQTERILRAMDHPHFSILGHPTGRLLLKRQPYEVDMLRIIRHAAERGCFIELNAHPERLDLFDVFCQVAKDEGVLVSINSDAHHPRDFDNLVYGVGQARRGWLEKQDVLNTRSLPDLLPLLKRTM